MNLLNWFEEKLNKTYPKEAQDIINYTIERSKMIEFSFENYGTYEVLNFNNLSNIVNGQTRPNDREDEHTNPYFAAREIEDFNNRYFPAEGITEPLPFARCIWGDKTWYIFFTENNEYPMLVNIDSATFKPRRSNSKISKFIPPGQLLSAETESENKLKLNYKTSYKEILPESQTFVTDGESICGVESYKELIEKTLVLSIDKFSITSFSGNEKNGMIIIILEINNVIKGEINVQGGTDWIDPAYIQQLNTILMPHLDGYAFSEFRDWNWGQEFGVVYASPKEIDLLEKAGYIRK